MAYSIEQVTTAIRASWDKDTSVVPDFWTVEQPEIGQSIPTSLVVQDLFGGLLARASVDHINGTTGIHYFNTNIPPDDETLDLTRDQYPEDQAFVIAPIDVEIRDDLFRNEDTVRRYNTLIGRVAERLAVLGGMMENA